MLASDRTFYLHSACCTAHWELVYDNEAGSYSLLCEQCGQDAGVDVTGPLIAARCTECTNPSPVVNDYGPNDEIPDEAQLAILREVVNSSAPGAKMDVSWIRYLLRLLEADHASE